MIPRLIGITGKAGAGKDTLADYLVRHFGAQKYSFALPLKQSLNTMFGWHMDQWNDREWKERVIPWLGKSPRQMAQTIGTEWGRELVHPQLWVLLAERKYIQHIDDYSQDFGAMPPFVIPDVRFTNEAEMIRSQNGVVIQLHRPGAATIAAHKSEDGVPDELVDITYINEKSIAEMCVDVVTILRAHRSQE